MNKKLLLLELIILSTTLIIPPLFIKNRTVDTKITEFSIFLVTEIIISVIFQLQHIHFSKNNEKKSFESLIKNLKWNAICLGSLMLIYAFSEALYMFVLKIETEINSSFIPENFIQWFILILNIVTGAFFEEVIYRQFLPESLLYLTDFNLSPAKNKIRIISIEIISLLVFAFSHRYLGNSAVINAFLCGTILRICYKKTESIWPGFAAHFVYNFLLILFNFISFIR